MKKTTKVTATPKAEKKSVKNVAKKAASESTKKNVTIKKKVTIKTKVSAEAKEAVARTFQGVEQFMTIDAKVIKKLGLKLKKYVKLDGTESTLYILTGKDEKATKHLHDLLTSGKLSKLCKYWGYVHGYKVSEKNLKEFVKLTGIKAA